MTNQDWTPLPAKWTPSSILKLHDRLWSNYLKVILDTDTLTKEEKNKRIDNNLPMLQLIHNYTMSGQMTYKKDAEKKIIIKK